MKYDFIFVVLVYRNTDDLSDFFAHFAVPDSKVIVVNSFYDELSESTFRIIAENYGADFISVPNNGYGAGNNRGIEYALHHYDFQYLVVSNADVLIKDLDFYTVQKYGNVIIAPEIRNVNGKRQNPSTPFTPSRLRENVHYWMIKRKYYKIIWILYVWSRLTKNFYYLISRWKKDVFSAHGAFLIIPKGLLDHLVPLYDERMFLFNEEEHLGRLAASKGIKTCYAKDIRIYHKEDGSMIVANVNHMKQTRQSYMIYYENWIKKRN